MFRLRDGVVCVVRKTDGGGAAAFAHDIEARRSFAIPADRVTDVFRLALGQPEPPRDPWFAGDGAALVGEAPSLVDPILRRELMRLDRHYEWFLAPLLSSPGAREIYGRYVDAHASRKVIRLDLLQVPLVPAAGFARVMRMARCERMSCLLLGDDDLLAVPLALLGHRVTVVDLDPFVLAFLTKAELGIDVMQRNVIETFPPEMEGRFHLVHSDPPNEPRDWGAILHRGLRCLSPEGRAYISIGDPVGRLLTQAVADLGGALVEVWQRISHYYAPGEMHIEPSVEDVRVFAPPADRDRLIPLDVTCPDDDLESHGAQLDFSLDLFSCAGAATAEAASAIADRVLGAPDGAGARGATDGKWWRFVAGDGVSLLLTGDEAERYVSADYRSTSGVKRAELLRALLLEIAPERYQLTYHYRGASLAEPSGGALVRR